MFGRKRENLVKTDRSVIYKIMNFVNNDACLILYLFQN